MAVINLKISTPFQYTDKQGVIQTAIVSIKDGAFRFEGNSYLHPLITHLKADGTMDAEGVEEYIEIPFAELLQSPEIVEAVSNFIWEKLQQKAWIKDYSAVDESSPTKKRVAALKTLAELGAAVQPYPVETPAVSAGGDNNDVEPQQGGGMNA